jgi:hypothetical protein
VSLPAPSFRPGITAGERPATAKRSALRRFYGNIHVGATHDGGGGLNSTGGLVILDTTEVASWNPGMPCPTIRRIGDLLLWSQPLSGISHTAVYFENNGSKYVADANEGGGCPAAHGQIVDVTYELHPVVVSSLRLEVNKPENCHVTRPDHQGLVLGDAGGVDGLLMQYRYGAHYAGNRQHRGGQPAGDDLVLGGPSPIRRLRPLQPEARG